MTADPHLDAVPPPSSTIGREGDLARLSSSLTRDRPIAVVGEAGIGKTTLVRAAAGLAARLLHEGGGYATLDWMPYLALGRAVGTRIAGDAPEAARRVEAVVGPDLLFIDDLQWVDRESRAVLELVAGRVGLVMAIRTGVEASAATLELARSMGSELVHLDGVPPEAAAAIARLARPGISGREVAHVVETGGGNPLLIEELARTGAGSGTLARAIASQLRDLAPDERLVVELLAAADRPLPARALGPAVASLVAARLAEHDGERVALRHALFGELTRASLGAAALAALHGRLAEPALSTEPLDVARHLSAAGRADDAARVALESLAAIEEPRDRAALLIIAADAAPPDARAQLRLGAARILDEVAEWPAVVRALDPIEGTGSEEDQAERDAILAHASFALGDPAAARAHLESANVRVISSASPAAARRAIETATLLVNVDGNVGAAIAALDETRPAGGAPSQAAADIDSLRASILLLATGAGEPAAMAASLEAAFAEGRYRTATDRARVIQYLQLMGSGAEAALGFLLAQRTRFEAVGVGAVALEFLADAVVAAVLAGRLDLGLTLADELLEVPAPPRPRQTAEIHRARALLLLGRFDQAGEALTSVADRASSDYFGRGEVLACQAELAFWSGQAVAAMELAEASCAIPPPIPIAHIKTRLTGAWARSELGHEPATVLGVALPRSLVGAEPELAGLRAWHAAEPAVAATEFDAAAALWLGFEASHALRCRWAAAESRRRAGAVDAAVDALHASVEDAMAIGLEPLAARARRSLRLAGVRTTAGRASGESTATARRGGRGHATATDSELVALVTGGLTARERELVALVERGLTNLEIARRLGLGRPTVARILASAMTKLGVSSRAQLAARAPR